MDQDSAGSGTTPRSRTPLRVLHLSDLELGGPAHGALDPRVAERAVEGLLHDLRHLPPLDLVVVTGDVSADGSTTAYAVARRLVGALAAAHDAPHVYAIGDRDDHERFAEVLGSGHLSPDDLDLGEPGPAGERHGWVSRAGGLRVVSLDTSVPGSRHGMLGEAQARWLTDVLATPAEGGTLLLLHHPPLAPAGHGPLAERALRDADRLAEAIEGSDVRAMLGGHLRVPLTGTLGGVPVVLAPGAVTRSDLTAPEHLDRVVTGGAGVVVEIGGAGSTLTYPVYARSRPGEATVSLTDARSGVSVDDEAAAPTARPLRPAATRPAIPAGETPGGAAGRADTQPDSWPSGLDSSARSVTPEPTYASSAPVWLEEPEEPAEDTEDTGVLSWAFGGAERGVSS